MILSVILMTASVLGSLEEAAQFNSSWATQTFRSHAEQVGPERVSVLYEDGLGDTKFGLGTSGKALRLGEKTYEHGIGVNARSVIRVQLPGPGKAFLADIGVDRNMDGSGATVTFRVETGEQTLFETEVVRPGEAPRPLEVALGGATVFDLIVDNGGDTRCCDQADWAAARVVLEDGSQKFVDGMARYGDGSVRWPFSFVYGGRPSCQLLPDWGCQAVDSLIDGGNLRTFTFTDPKTKLEVRAEAKVYTDTPGTDWTLYFENKGDAATPVLERVRVLDMPFKIPPGSAATFHSLRSTCGVDDWLPFSEALPAGARRDFAPTNGRSSLGACCLGRPGRTGLRRVRPRPPLR